MVGKTAIINRTIEVKSCLNKLSLKTTINERIIDRSARGKKKKKLYAIIGPPSESVGGVKCIMRGTAKVIIPIIYVIILFFS